MRQNSGLINASNRSLTGPKGGGLDVNGNQQTRSLKLQTEPRHITQSGRGINSSEYSQAISWHFQRKHRNWLSAETHRLTIPHTTPINVLVNRKRGIGHHPRKSDAISAIGAKTGSRHPGSTRRFSSGFLLPRPPIIARHWGFFSCSFFPKWPVPHAQKKCKHRIVMGILQSTLFDERAVPSAQKDLAARSNPGK